jgi:hypothetical protein
MTPTQMQKLDALAAELGDRIRPEDRQLASCLCSLLALHGAGYPLGAVADTLAAQAYRAAQPLMQECYQ